MTRWRPALALILAVTAPAASAPLDRNPDEPTNLPPPPPPAPPPPPPIPRTVTVTLSPFHLAFPLLEVTGELNVTPKLSGSLIAGFGRFSDRNGLTEGRALELGGQVSYYFYQRFRGLHVGGEAIYVHVDNVVTDSSLTGAGLAIGPFVGWKYIHRTGFTFVVQGGLQAVIAGASNSSGTSSDRTVIPLLNLNVGWSF